MNFSTIPFAIDTWTVIRLPQDVSDQLSSRGMGMATVTIGAQSYMVALEPDGRGSHWFRVTNDMPANAGESVDIQLQSLKVWTRPEVPSDLAKAFASNPAANDLWNKITVKAQWEWIRWIRATHVAATRAKRIDVACSKLNKGMRRPCCFNSSACSEPAVAHNWMLREPATVSL